MNICFKKLKYNLWTQYVVNQPQAGREERRKGKKETTTRITDNRLMPITYAYNRPLGILKKNVLATK